MFMSLHDVKNITLINAKNNYSDQLHENYATLELCIETENGCKNTITLFSNDIKNLTIKNKD